MTLLAGACVLPTDQSASVGLAFTSPPRQVLVGASVQLDVEVSGLGTVRPGDVVYTSSDPGVVRVDARGRVTGIGEGSAEVTARLTRFENAPPATHRIYSSRGIVVAEIIGLEGNESRLRLGETARIRGFRLDPDSLVEISVGGLPAEVADYLPAESGDPDALEELRVYVPVVAGGSELLLVHANGGSASRTLDILQEDVFELFGTPYTVDVGPEGFLAPALTVAFPEEDLFRFRMPAGDWTIVVRQLSGLDFLAGGTFGLLLAGRDATGDHDETPWGRDHSRYACALRGPFRNFYPAFRREGAQAFALPLRLDDPRTLDLRVVTEADFLIAYRLEVHPGYLSDLEPDQAEGNDFCNDAAPLEPGEVRSLTFDNASDHDWFEFEVPGETAPRAVRVRDEAEPNDDSGDAEVLRSGDRIWGDRNQADDTDWFRFEARAGQLIDLEGVGDRLPGIPPGREEFSQMIVGLRLYDAGGTLLEVGGLSEFELYPNRQRLRGTDAMIRWVAPVDGIYYVAVDGAAGLTSLADVGPWMYYRLDLRLHDSASRVELSALGPSDPGLALVAVDDTDVQNTLVRTRFDEGAEESFSELLPPGRYRALAWPEAGPGPYSLWMQLTAPTNRPWPGGGR